MTETILPTRAPTHQEFEQLYRIYKLEYELAQPEFNIENIRFVHDPDWRNKWFSIQAVGDMERAAIKGMFSPYVSAVGYVGDVMFWTWFDMLDKRPKTRESLRSLPPRIAMPSSPH